MNKEINDAFREAADLEMENPITVGCDFISLPNYDPDADPVQREATDYLRWRTPSIEDIKNYFELAVKNNLFKFEDIISANQVKKMLDPNVLNVVISEKFFLKRVLVEPLKLIGTRYFKASNLLGPIIVDNDGLGNKCVIKGKHQVLDAKDRGEDTILAWVGEKVLEINKRWHISNQAPLSQQVIDAAIQIQAPDYIQAINKIKSSFTNVNIPTLKYWGEEWRFHESVKHLWSNHSSLVSGGIYVWY